jgi:hypothetical protein
MLATQVFPRTLKGTRWMHTPARFPLLLLPFAGGVGLVMHILVNASLPLAMLGIAVSGAVAWWWSMRGRPPVVRRRIRRTVLSGLRIGLVATAAYDLVRYGVVMAFSMSFQPLHVIPIFGHLFVGAGAPIWLAWLVGFAYHIGNGVGFGIAYVVLFRRPHPVTGILWGLGLELAMATLYPSWLRVTALREFLTVSMIGHVVYGVVLGLLARQLTSTGRPLRVDGRYLASVDREVARDVVG